VLLFRFRFWQRSSERVCRFLSLGHSVTPGKKLDVLQLQLRWWVGVVGLCSPAKRGTGAARDLFLFAQALGFGLHF
jgi:hypothetical protein